MIDREEEVRDGEQYQISRSEFEQFQAGSLRYVCNGQRMKPQKIKSRVWENTPELWWVEFRKWPQKLEDLKR